MKTDPRGISPRSTDGGVELRLHDAKDPPFSGLRGPATLPINHSTPDIQIWVPLFLPPPVRPSAAKFSMGRSRKGLALLFGLHALNDCTNPNNFPRNLSKEKAPEKNNNDISGAMAPTGLYLEIQSRAL